MTSPGDANSVVLRGTWLYAGSVPCEVRIVRSSVRHGSGDTEDPQEVANDQDVECYYLEYQTTAGTPKWVGGGSSQSIAEAKQSAALLLGASLKWQE
jgi:hypothetical protein